MLRSIFAVVLLPSLIAPQTAQTQPVPPVQSVGVKTPQIQRPPMPPYRSITFYNGIRRGTDEEVAIQVQLSDYFTTPRTPISGIDPLHLELEPADGFTFTHLRYPKARKQSVKFQLAAFPVAGSQIYFKVRASQNVPLGIHVLKAKLTVQPVNAILGTGAVRQLDIEIPIKVVEHDARVTKNPWPETHLPVAVWVVIIVLSPVLIAVWLPLNLICTMAGSKGCLD